MSNPTCRQMEKAAGMVLAGSGMQVGGRTVEVMVMNVAIRMRSSIWVGEMQFGERIGGGDGDEHSNYGEVDDIGRGDAVRREDGWEDGEERSSSGEVGDMGRGDAIQREDGWGDGDERNSSDEVDGMGRGKGGRGVG